MAVDGYLHTNINIDSLLPPGSLVVTKVYETKRGIEMSLGFVCIQHRSGHIELPYTQRG